MSTKWIETKPFEMEDEVKKLKKTLNSFVQVNLGKENQCQVHNQ